MEKREEGFWGCAKVLTFSGFLPEEVIAAALVDVVLFAAVEVWEGGGWGGTEGP